MKRILIALLIIIPFVSFAQNQDGPTEKELNSYIGKDVAILPDPLSEVTGYENFLQDYKEPGSDKPFLGKEGEIQSSYKALVDQVFKVTAVFKDQYHLYIELKNDKLGKCYFRYTPGPNTIWPFKLTSEMKYSPGSICNALIIDKDKFTNEVTTRTGIGVPVVLTRHDKGGVITYTVLVSAYSLSTDLGNGVNILLDDKTQISRDMETNVKYISGDKYYHYAVFRLTNEELQRLKTHNITDIRVYQYDQNITDGDKLKQLINCASDGK